MDLGDTASRTGGFVDHTFLRMNKVFEYYGRDQYSGLDERSQHQLKAQVFSAKWRARYSRRRPTIPTALMWKRTVTFPY
jgi:hypothetical protein